jgi:hypothetical protein
LVLFRDGREVSRASSRELVYATNRPGAYRAEAWLPGRREPPMPWAVGNPIFVGRHADPPAPSGGGRRVISSIAAGGGDWHVEHDPQSSGTFDTDGRTALRYRIGRGQGRSQFAALARDGRIPAGAEGLAFLGAAAAPMRVSVQLRVTRSDGAERWARTVYLDPTPREVFVAFDDMRPAGTTRSRSPRLGEVGSLLFVVDRTHATAGSAGEFTISELKVLGAPTENGK